MKWFVQQNIFSHRKMAALAFDLDSQPSAPPPEMMETEEGKLRCRRIKSLGTGETEQLENAFAQMDCKPMFDIPEAQSRLEKGYFLTLAEKADGAIAGWTWAAVDKVYFSEFNCTIDLKPGQGFSYSTYVAPAFRGKQVNHRMKAVQFYHLKQEGYQRIWCLIYPWNRPSMRSLEKMGWERIGDYTFIKLFFMNLKFPPKGI